ncbi:MAG: hypothetical protein ABEH78_01425 [Haloferacaceae archaeon]
MEHVVRAPVGEFEHALVRIEGERAPGASDAECGECEQAEAGVGGYSAVSADRGVTVAVASDENADLGIEVVGLDRCGKQKPGIVELRNPFGSGTTLTHVAVTVVDTDGGLDVTITDVPDELQPGASGVSMDGGRQPTGRRATNRSPFASSAGAGTQA